MLPRYPVYIVSKGRWKNRLTSRALDLMGVPYKMIVEQDQLFEYQAEIGQERCLVLPQRYFDEYDTCDEIGDSKSKGPGPARNFAWDHAIKTGNERHWVMDDNLDAFHRLNRNIKREADTPAVFAAMEDFVDRYENVPLAGPNYYSFVKAADKVPAFIKNTRIYSCLLIQNNAPYRWRGRYNEDTDLSLRILKDGLCTIQFNAFLQGKVTTQRMRGGNTDEFYGLEGTKAKSQMLADLHPDVAEVVWRFNRWHHHVDYRPFKKNKLKRRSDIVVPKGINNYGMKLVRVDA
jgi:hypothetical protein